MAETSLSTADTAELMEQEAIIEAGGRAFTGAINAIMVIKAKELYREYGTFDEYLEQRWGYERTYVNRLINAVRMAGSGLLPIGDKPIRESHLRTLRTFDEDLQPAILKLAVAEAEKENRPLTALDIENVGHVLVDAANTGGVHLDDTTGEPTALDAAITQERHDRILRQQSVIKNSYPTHRTYIVKPREVQIRNVVSAFNMVNINLVIKTEDGEDAEMLMERIYAATKLKLAMFTEVAKK